MDGAAPHHIRNHAVVGLGVLQDLDILNRYWDIVPSRRAARNKRDLIGQCLVFAQRPVLMPSRAGVTHGVVVDPMIVALPNTLTRGAGDDTNGNRPPGSYCQCDTRG